MGVLQSALTDPSKCVLISRVSRRRRFVLAGSRNVAGHGVAGGVIIVSGVAGKDGVAEGKASGVGKILGMGVAWRVSGSIR